METFSATVPLRGEQAVELVLDAIVFIGNCNKSTSMDTSNLWKLVKGYTRLF